MRASGREGGRQTGRAGKAGTRTRGKGENRGHGKNKQAKSRATIYGISMRARKVRNGINMWHPNDGAALISPAAGLLSIFCESPYRAPF